MKASKIDEEINRVLLKLASLSPSSARYSTAVKNLETLYEARSKKRDRLVETGPLIIAGANILGILIVLNYEQAHVIASQAWSQVSKLRL